MSGQRRPSMDLKTELASRFKAQIASKFIKALAGGLVSVGLAHLLDPDTYGVLFLALTVIGVFTLVAENGIARSAGRYVAEYKESDPTQVPHIVRLSLLGTLGTTLLAVIALVASHGVLATRLDEPSLAPFLLLGALFVVFRTSVLFLEMVLQGLEEITFVAIMNVFGRVGRLVLALGLVVAGFGALGALWGYVLSALLASLIGFAYLFRRVRGLVEDGTPVEPGLRRRLFEYAVPITATNMSRILDYHADTLLVGYFLSPVAVSYYVIAGQVVRFLETPLSALQFTLSPTFGAQKAAGNDERISRIYEETLMKGLLLYVPAGAGIVLVAEPAVRLLFGAEYAGAVPVLQVLGVYVILKAIIKVSDNGLDYLGRARERAIARAITAGLNVGLNVVLVPTVGVVGAAIATVATYGLYTVANVYIAAQEFDLRRGYVWKNTALIVAITGAMSAVVFGLSAHISGWISLGLVVGVGVLVWAVLSAATGLLQVRRIVSIMR